MVGTKRIAVLGLYNSGSTAVAGMLHRLGVNMGPPFWMNSQEGDENNFYESLPLSLYLRACWSEPRGVERVSAAQRIEFLAQWMMLQEFTRPGPVGAKHPLLSLCGPELAAAWGPQTLFIWSWRPFEESLAGLQRRGWFIGREKKLQQQLWDALTAFKMAHPGVAVLDWRQVRSKPAWAARQLAAWAGIVPTVSQLQAAVESVHQPEEHAVGAQLTPIITITTANHRAVSTDRAAVGQSG